MLREQRSDDCFPRSDSRRKSLPRWSGPMKTPVPSTYNSALQSWTTVSFSIPEDLTASMWDIFSDAPVDCRPNEQCKIQRRSSSGASCKTNTSHVVSVVGTRAGPADRDRGKPHQVQQSRLSSFPARDRSNRERQRGNNASVLALAEHVTGSVSHLCDVASLKQHSCTTVMLGAHGSDVNDWKHVEPPAFGRHVICLTYTEGTLGGALDPSGVPPCTVLGPSEGSGRHCNLPPAGMGLKGQIVDKGRLLASCHERLDAAGTPVTFTSCAALNAAEGHDPACPLQTPCA